MKPFPTLQIKRVQPNKLSEISNDDFKALLDDDSTLDLEQAKKFLADPNNLLVVAYWHAKLVGFVSAHRLQRFDHRKAEVLIYEVSVEEKYRQRGIAKSLIDEVKRWAKEVDADEAWVLTYSSNQAAMALYKSTGGEQDEPGTRMFTYKI